MLYGPWLSDCAAAWQSGARGGCRGAVLTALAVACLVHSSAPEEYVGALRERCLEDGGDDTARKEPDDAAKEEPPSSSVPLPVPLPLPLRKPAVVRKRPRAHRHALMPRAHAHSMSVHKDGGLACAIGARGARARLRHLGGIEVVGSKRTRARGRVGRGLGSDGMVGEGGIPEWVPEWVHAACGIGLENGDDGDGGGGRGIGACLLPLAWMQLR